MSDRTRIAWCDATWSPVVGCSPAGVGCLNCYAKRMAQRLKNMGNPLYRGVVIKGLWNGTVAIAHADTWNKPLTWRKPRRIFVCSMGDLFHPEVPRKAIDSVAQVAVDCPQHTFLWLTKRAERMAEYTRENPPPPNVWCGVSASNVPEMRSAIGQLSATKARVRWVSLEPMVERIPAFELSWGLVGWLVVGCESGPKRRPMKLEWLRELMDLPHPPIFIKQLDINGRVSHETTDFPEDLQVREFPE